MLNNKKCIPCQGGIPRMNSSEILKFQKFINEDWKVNNDQELAKDYSFKSYSESIRFANKVADLSEEQGHHPYIHINFKSVKIILFTHKIAGLHENDFLMANKIDELILS